jgi:hypothetical protein
MSQKKPATDLKKSLSLTAAVMAVAGSMIGSEFQKTFNDG